jgi:hypothetical protein
LYSVHFPASFLGATAAAGLSGGCGTLLYLIFDPNANGNNVNTAINASTPIGAAAGILTGGDPTAITVGGNLNSLAGIAGPSPGGQLGTTISAAMGVSSVAATLVDIQPNYVYTPPVTVSTPFVPVDPVYSPMPTQLDFGNSGGDDGGGDYGGGGGGGGMDDSYYDYGYYDDYYEEG